MRSFSVKNGKLVKNKNQLWYNINIIHVKEYFIGLNSLYLGFLTQYLANFLLKFNIHYDIANSKSFSSISLSFKNTIFPINGD